MKSVKTSHKLLLALAIIPFLIVNIATLKDGHDWGGDFAQYIRQGKNILEAKDYASGLMLDQWVVTPPGFSFLLVPVLKYFGLNFVVLKSLNIIFWLLFVIVIFLIFRKRLGEDYALLGSLVLLSSPDFFVFKHNIVSDISFLFFLTAALFTFSNYVDEEKVKENNKKTLTLVLSACLMSCAFLIRWAGVSLFVSAVLYLIIVKRAYRVSLLFVLLFFILAGFQSWMGITGTNYLKEIPPEFSAWSMLFGFDQTGSVFSAIGAFFVPLKTIISVPIYSFIEGISKVIGPFLFCAILAFTVYRGYKRKISHLGLFFVIYLTGMLLWPVPAGRRYIFPVVGLSIIFIIEQFDYFWQRVAEKSKAIKISSQKIVILVLVFLLAHNCLTIMVYFRYDPNEIYKAENRELVYWVKKNVSASEYFMFFKPRVLGLLTDRMGAAFWIDYADKDIWHERIDKFNITYIIFKKGSKEYSTAINDLGPKSLGIEKKWENSAYVVYKKKG